MIYDNLGDCYEKDELDNVAMEAIARLSDKRRRGQHIQCEAARMFLLQNRKDSALFLLSASA